MSFLSLLLEVETPPLGAQPASSVPDLRAPLRPGGHSPAWPKGRVVEEMKTRGPVSQRLLCPAAGQVEVLGTESV